MDINELKTLGFNSENDADAAEWALGIRFSDFSSEDRRTWRLQELCLKQYALTPDYERAARRAGVTVGEVEAWERNNVLGFVKRKEEAELRFSDTIQVVLLEMAKKPDSPPLLLSWLLHMHMPEKFDVLTPEDMADDPPGPTEAEILQQVAEQYNRVVRERERLLDEEELLVKSEIENSVSAEILPSERVSYWQLDDSDRTRNN
ncbi:MAG: hypothetical protein F4X72_07440 [Dehalococcoidia bacterium]|nr:hypothetical protein [Dehalococcoidia bacterium]